MTSVRAIVLDFNGTLAPDDHILGPLYVDAFASTGASLNPEEYQRDLSALHDCEVFDLALAAPAFRPTLSAAAPWSAAVPRDKWLSSPTRRRSTRALRRSSARQPAGSHCDRIGRLPRRDRIRPHHRPAAATLRSPRCDRRRPKRQRHLEPFATALARINAAPRPAPPAARDCGDRGRYRRRLGGIGRGRGSRRDPPPLIRPRQRLRGRDH